MCHKNKQCIDAGSRHCPCILAVNGDCLVCSRLAGHNYCDCVWQGVCIYNEYIQNGGRHSTGGMAMQRQGRICKLQKIKWYQSDLAVMRLAVPKGMAEEASLPGSYVFVKNPEADPFFFTPLSVMRSSHEEGFLELAVKVSGPKTKALLEAWKQPVADFGGKVELRGIYHNGLLGGDKLRTPEVKNVLCLTRGTGLAPLVNYCRWSGCRDHTDFIIDTENITGEFVYDCMKGCDPASVQYGRLPLDMTWEAQESYDLIVLSASEYYQEKIYIPDQKKVLSNNHIMCCGEGICGACMITDKNGCSRRMCKCSNISG